MKHLFRLLIAVFALTAAMSSCGTDPVGDKDLVLTPSKTVVANGEEVTFTVKYGEDDVTSSATIKTGETTLTGNKFATTEAGNYTFKAEYDGKTSPEVSVTVEEKLIEGKLNLTADKNTIIADDKDAITFTVRNGEDYVTGDATIKVDGVAIPNHIFTSTEVGAFSVKAEYDGMVSNELIVTVTEKPLERLTLTASKSRIYADGMDEAVFTVKQGSVDITDQVSICMQDGLCLVSNIFTSAIVGHELGTYRFYATRLDDVEGKNPSRTISVVVETPAPISFYLSKGSVEVNDAVTFMAKYNGSDISNDITVYKSDDSAAGQSFSSSTPGEYGFYAKYTLASGEVMTSEIATLKVIPAATAAFDANREPHKNVTFFTYTSTRCGPCYTFKSWMLDVESRLGRNMVNLNFYSSPSFHFLPSDEKVGASITDLFITQMDREGSLQWGGFPFVVATLSEEVGVPGYIATAAQVEAAYNKNIGIPARTAFRVISEVEGNQVKVNLTVGAKDAGTYKIGVLLVEDNIVAPQAGSPGEYNHTHVLRSKATDSLFGDDFGTLTAGETVSKDYSLAFDPTYKNGDLSVAVYILAEVSGKWIIVNSVKAPLGVVDFQYA